MKKIKCLIVLLVISVFLTGCGKSATDSVKKYLDNYKNLDDKVLVDMKNVIDKENLNEENSKKYEDIFAAVEYLNKKLSNIDCTDEVEYIITYHLLYLSALNFYKYNNKLLKIL